MFKTISALILREVKYKEADKILTVLTPEDGKLTVKARGALRKSCRYGAACQALCYSEKPWALERERGRDDRAVSYAALGPCIAGAGQLLRRGA